MLLSLRKKKTVTVTAMANLQVSPHVHSHDLVTLLGLNTALYISPQLGAGGWGVAVSKMSEAIVTSLRCEISKKN